MVFDPPRQNQSAKRQEGGDDVIPYVPVSVSLDKSTSESVDPSVSVSSSRSADPGLVRVSDIPRSAELL